MWYAKWNKAMNQFDVSGAFIPGATKGTTKQKLFNQLRNNFAYIMSMRKYGKVVFVLTEMIGNGAEKRTTTYKMADSSVVRTGHTLIFADKTRENYPNHAKEGFKYNYSGSALYGY